jgi:DNA replication protein DnaC
MDNEAFRRARMFKRYWDASYEASSPAQAWVLERVEEYIAADVPGQGLLLVGPPGTGKTLLAHTVLRAKHDAGMGPVRACTMANFIGWNQELMDLSKMLEAPECAARFLRVRKTLHNLERKYKWLLVDDVGKEYIGSSNWSQTKFNTLVRNRGDAMMPTILTTNGSLASLEEVYGDAMASYLREVCCTIPVIDLDHRKM